MSLITFLGPGSQILSDGFTSFVNNKPNMNTLVSLGACSSFAMSAISVAIPKLGWPLFFEEPTMLFAFVLFGRALESRAKILASSDLSSLLNLMPRTAKKLHQQDLVKLLSNDSGEFNTKECRNFDVVPSGSLLKEDVVVVMPGDVFAVDGTVIMGMSSVDEATINGEALPILKSVGDSVFAGTANCDGLMLVKVAKAGEDTQLAEVIRLTEEATMRAPNVQRIADVVSGKFVYTVMTASIMTFAFWKTIGHKMLLTKQAASLLLASPTSIALQLAASVLVVACPCALGLATPTAVLVGTSVAARRGLLIRGGDVLELLANCTAIVFDKTGTLTIGKPRVCDIVVDEESALGKLEMLELAASVESASTHPLANAIVNAALHDNETINYRGIDRSQQKDYSLPILKSGTFYQEAGLGALGNINGQTVFVGSKEWLQSHGITIRINSKRDESGEQSTSDAISSSTKVHVGIDSSYLGYLYISDTIRSDAVELIAKLQQRNVDLYILSGDDHQNVLNTASHLKIPLENVFGNMKPKDKAQMMLKIRQMVSGKETKDIRRKHTVAMVGDGINDTAALANSDISIVMNNAVDVAADVSNVVLRGDKLMQIYDVLDISKKTMRKIYENLFLSFAYNVTSIPFASGLMIPALGPTWMLSPSSAGLMMGMSSVTVMANSLLLRISCKGESKKVTES